jgi:hypothetical protein
LSRCLCLLTAEIQLKLIPAQVLTLKGLKLITNLKEGLENE